MKHEIKVEFSNTEVLKNIIEKAYFQEGLGGKILGKNHYITVDEQVEDICYTVFKGLNNATVKITNNDIIDGAMRFLIDETRGEVRIYPVSIYCIKEEEKYSFY